MGAMSPPSLVDTLGALKPLIEACADEAERERRLPGRLVTAMAEVGLFRLWIPRALGGGEADGITFLRVVEAISQVDGAAGWCMMIAGAYGALSGYLPTEAAREIYGADPRVITGGTLRPLGQATVVDGGYRVTGRWPLGSGCHHCTWLVGGCRIFDGDQPRLRQDGSPAWRLLFFPVAACEIIDTWHSTGLQGTGSNDYAVADLFVPATHGLSFRESPVQPGPLYALPTIGLFATAIAAVPLGIARHAIDLLTELAGRKEASRSRQLLSRQAMLQADLGRAEALLRSGRAFLHEALGEAWEVAAAGRELSVKQRAMLWLAATQATTAATQAVDLMFSAGGAAATYRATRLERCLRDVRTAAAHICVVPANYEMAGQALLGLDMSMTPLLLLDDRSAA